MADTLRHAEICAGAGGMVLGFERAGWETAWLAENVAFPAAVLRHHWPTVPLYGDVRELDGAALTRDHGPIVLLSGGTPCQDLSCAGQRAGIDGSRSSLFFDLMRLWTETGAPLCLWENVPGAFTTNNGRDFAAVLSAFVGAAVAVPRAGWRSAGVAAGPTGVAAWRVLDAQFFGVPQRRRRVFVLGARTGAPDPAEVLLDPEGSGGNPPARRAPRQETPSGVGGRVTLPWDDECNPGYEVIGTLPARAGKAGATRAGVCAFHLTQDPISGDVSPALGASTSGMGILAFQPLQGGGLTLSDVSPTLEAGNGSKAPAIVAFDTDLVLLNGSVGEVAPTLNGKGKASVYASVAPNEAAPSVLSRNYSNVGATGEVTHALTSEGADGSEDGTGRRTPIVARFVRSDQYAVDGVGSTLAARVARGPQDIALDSRPRRLLPIETERLQGWPDDHTNILGAKDSHRYRAIGNGVANPVAEWIARRVGAALLPAVPTP